jgi:hypothetical protein
MRRSGTAVLSASLDPACTATVDGHVGTVQMAAPALVATSVPSGVHTIVLRYERFGASPELLVLSALSVLGLAAAEWHRRKRVARRSRTAQV